MSKLTVKGGVLIDTSTSTPIKHMSYNSYSILQRYVDFNQTNYLTTIPYLASIGAKYIRCVATTLYKSTWQSNIGTYVRDGSNVLNPLLVSYFAKVDAFLKVCNDNNVSVIFDLFWAPYRLTDMFGEHYSDIKNPNSATSLYMVAFTKEFVSRYVDNNAIAGWEIANEVDGFIEAAKITPVDTGTGSPGPYSAPLDLVDVETLQNMQAMVVGTIRSIDKIRMISSGNACFYYSSVSGILSFSNLISKILNQNGPCDTVSLHLYPSPSQDFLNPLWARNGSNMMESLNKVIAAVKAAGKAVIIGEFGAPSYKLVSTNRVDVDYTRVLANKMYSEIANSECQLAMEWDFDTPNSDAKWNISPTDSSENRNLKITEMQPYRDIPYNYSTGLPPKWLATPTKAANVVWGSGGWMETATLTGGAATALDGLSTTVSFWYKHSQNGNTGGNIARYGTIAAQGWQVLDHGGTGFIYFNRAGNNTFKTNESSLSPRLKDKWCHYVFMHTAGSGGGHIVAQDGVYINTLGNPAAHVAPTTKNITFGNSASSGGSSPLNGQIAEFKVYPRTLTEKEIGDLYYYDAGPTDYSFYWPLNGDLLDKGPYGYNLTAGSGVSFVDKLLVNTRAARVQ